MEEFDFTKHYKRGDITFLVRCYNDLGIQEVKKLTIRSVFNTYMVGCGAKSKAFVIDKSNLPNLFKTNQEANTYLDSIAKKIKPLTISDEDLYYIQCRNEELEDKGGEEDE